MRLSAAAVVVCALLAACTARRQADAPVAPFDPTRLSHDQHAAIPCTTCHRTFDSGGGDAVMTTAVPGADDHKPCDDAKCHAVEFTKPPGKLCKVCHEDIAIGGAGSGAKAISAPLRPFPSRDVWQAMPPKFSHKLHLDRGKLEQSVGFHVQCADCHVQSRGGATGPGATGALVPPDHATCARCHAAEVGLANAPAMDACVACHQRGVQERRRHQLITDDLRFDHDRHQTDRKGTPIRCEECHTQTAAADSTRTHASPRVEQCVTCHDDTERTPETERMRVCETCHANRTNTLTGLAPRNHLPLTERPIDHTIAFRRDHAEAATHNTARCAACHTQMSGNAEQACDECHQTMKPADHRITWRELDHGPDAVADRDRCASCHVIEFCNACHAQRPRSHGVDFTGEHAALARVNVRPCVTCHAESYCDRCHATRPAARQSIRAFASSVHDASKPRRGIASVRQLGIMSLALAAISTTTAAADPDLAVHQEPAPTHLRMRARRTAAIAPTAAPAPAAAAKPAPPASPAVPSSAPAAGNDLALRDIQQPVSVSVNVGYQVEGTQATGKGTLANPDGKLAANSFQLLRAYGFGEGYLSTRGVLVPSMSTYFSLRFQAAPDTGVVNPGAPPELQRVRPPPIATWFERSGTELRTGWAELKDFAPGLLKSLRVRAGDMYVYGPWMMHVDGALAALETKLLRVQAYAGSRASDYTRELAVDRANVGGASARVDLRGLPSPLPIAVAVEGLTLGPSGSKVPGSTTVQYEADWRPKQDFALIGKVRTLDGNVAHENLEFRGRYKQVSNVVVELERRTADDWRWDPAFANVIDTKLTARPYLDLGLVRPQIVGSIRGGTLIAENLDLYAKLAIAKDQTPDGAQRYSTNASYVEAAGALQMRLRRTIAIDASVLTRQNSLQKPDAVVDDAMAPAGCGATLSPTGLGSCLPLPDPATTGETGFTEVGTAARMSLGARKLSATLELFGRKTRYAELYSTVSRDNTSDVRGGGRFSVEAWVGKRVRLYAAYDVSTRFEFAPEISGYKSLRLVLTGNY